MSEENFNRLVSSELQGNSYLNSETVYSIRWAQNEIAKLRADNRELIDRLDNETQLVKNLKEYIGYFDHAEAHVRNHKTVKLGSSVAEETLRLLKERDELEELIREAKESQPVAEIAGVTPELLTVIKCRSENETI